MNLVREKQSTTVEMLETDLTPIEIAIGIDDDGYTTAKGLYEWLELDPTHYVRWVQDNILDNPFVSEDEFSPLKAKTSPKGGRPTKDYRITATLAKKLAMTVKTERGEQARAYFVACEQGLKRLLKERVKWKRERDRTTFLRNMLTDAIRDSGENERMHGHGYSAYTDLVYRQLFGKSAKDLREEKGLTAKEDLRDSFTGKDLLNIQTVESYICNLMNIGMGYTEIKDKVIDYVAALKAQKAITSGD